MQKIFLDGLGLHAGELNDFSDHISNYHNNSQELLIIVHINLRNYYFMHKDTELMKNIKEYSLPVLDGIGMKFAVLLKKKIVVNDLNGTDLFPLVMDSFDKAGKRIFIIGGTQNVVRKTVESIRKNYRRIIISGYNNGFLREDEEESIVDRINQAGAEVLLLSMSFPLEEQFAFRNREKLKVKMIWNLGGLFDILSGEKKRAPLSLRKIRLEWLYRFLKEPGRMIHRNTVAAFWSISHILFNDDKQR
ncbi:MAG: WecB/TagA/CpsF family glycosyltransferase [Ignavibacteria bacterium]|nr:WecB/TagA/CpsF family glycosyltransferase [Ignavibacteria bacterium]MBK9226780.1 WecB/TagA/CpsF family glycosyltransferase [Ignavibacteria bacterium]